MLNILCSSAEYIQLTAYIQLTVHTGFIVTKMTIMVAKFPFGTHDSLSTLICIVDGCTRNRKFFGPERQKINTKYVISFLKYSISKPRDLLFLLIVILVVITEKKRVACLDN